MIALDRAMTEQKLRSKMTLQVHDELLFDVVPEEPEALKTLVKHEMEHVAEFSVPITADIALRPNWRDINNPKPQPRAGDSLKSTHSKMAHRLTRLSVSTAS